VPQDIGHLFKARAVVEHVGRGGMAKEMAPSAGADGHASTLERVLHHPPDRTVGQRLKWRTALEEDLAVETLRPPVLHVGNDGTAHVLWQG